MFGGTQSGAGGDTVHDTSRRRLERNRQSIRRSTTFERRILLRSSSVLPRENNFVFQNSSRSIGVYAWHRIGTTSMLQTRLPTCPIISSTHDAMSMPMLVASGQWPVACACAICGQKSHRTTLSTPSATADSYVCDVCVHRKGLSVGFRAYLPLLRWHQQLLQSG